jgi:hypothetical protein
VVATVAVCHGGEGGGSRDGGMGLRSEGRCRVWSLKRDVLDGGDMGGARDGEREAARGDVRSPSEKFDHIFSPLHSFQE